jgi:hypothetical protein
MKGYFLSTAAHFVSCTSAETERGWREAKKDGVNVFENNSTSLKVFVFLSSA